MVSEVCRYLCFDGQDASDGWCVEIDNWQSPERVQLACTTHPILATAAALALFAVLGGEN